MGSFAGMLKVVLIGLVCTSAILCASPDNDFTAGWNTQDDINPTSISGVSRFSGDEFTRERAKRAATVTRTVTKTATSTTTSTTTRTTTRTTTKTSFTTINNCTATVTETTTGTPDKERTKRHIASGADISTTLIQPTPSFTLVLSGATLAEPELVTYEKLSQRPYYSRTVESLNEHLQRWKIIPMGATEEGTATALHSSQDLYEADLDLENDYDSIIAQEQAVNSKTPTLH